VLCGCHGSQRGTPTQPAPRLTPRALDAQQQRLVAAYEPVSRAMTGYELAYRSWLAGALAEGAFRTHAVRFRSVVAVSLRRVRRQRVTGATGDAKRALAAGLESRRRALEAILAGDRAAYRRAWERSVVDARRGLTKLQDLRDRARLIPLPEDSIS
jgi:hypothetical protein